MAQGGGMVPDGKKTHVQKLSDLVEWYLADRDVELKFAPNKKHAGSCAPEFDFIYYMDGRRISERALAMSIITELSRMNYNFHLAKIISAMTAVAWRHYVQTQEYPEWMASHLTEMKGPVGRPRKHPKKIPFDAIESVNTKPTTAKETV